MTVERKKRRGAERLEAKPSCVSAKDYDAWRAAALDVSEFVQNIRRGCYRQHHPFCLDCSAEYAGKMRAVGRCDYPHFNPQPEGERTTFGRRPRPVIGRSIDGKTTLEFDSMKAAARYMHDAGLSRSKSSTSIRAAIGKPNLSANGYRWEYADGGQKNTPQGMGGKYTDAKHTSKHNRNTVTT